MFVHAKFVRDVRISIEVVCKEKEKRRRRVEKDWTSDDIGEWVSLREQDMVSVTIDIWFTYNNLMHVLRYDMK